ncbi:MAG: amino acid permease [Rhabdochlamydiaceae bacterium]
MHLLKNMSHLLGGILLVAGTSIGVGMLALPVATAEGGFLPSVLVYIVCWLFMLCTGLLILECCLWMPKGANLTTLASRLLGKGGTILCWITYLYLFSCLMIAHVTAGGHSINQFFFNALPFSLSSLIYITLFAPFVYLGAKWVDRINLILMLGVISTYIIFVGGGIQEINFKLLSHMNWAKAWLPLPLVFTAFGYQGLIPTLLTHLDRNVSKVRICLFFGTLIPLFIYVIWEFLVLGIVPLEGDFGLLEAFKKGENAIAPLIRFTNHSYLSLVGQYFAFFTMTTSMFGLSIAFIDFLIDGLKLKGKKFQKTTPFLIVFVLPMLVSWVDPEIFLTALNYAGGYGVALLLGAMPILMVWRGRYTFKFGTKMEQLKGGKITLFLLFVFVLFEIYLQIKS